MLTWNTDDTICAIASGAAASQRGIVRLSGAKAIEIAEGLTRPDTSYQPTQLDGSKAKVTAIEFRRSEIWLGKRMQWIPGATYWWRTHKSYTGQPAVEFHLLGCLPILESLLAQCCAAGARIAQPGEFTLRAFLAGRMDLSQAEAVLGVINARGEAELHRALDQLAGGLAKPVAQIRFDLIHALAHLEAGLDFVDEDIEFISAAELEALLSDALGKIQDLQKQIEYRNISYGTPKIVLAGRPNAGKSSLFNALLNHATAIVSAERGTTRDYVSASLKHKGSELELVDTAGLDDSLFSEIDRESQARSKRQIQEATIVLHVIDATSDQESEIHLLQSTVTQVASLRHMVVLNKIDAIREPDLAVWQEKLKLFQCGASVCDHVSVSAKTGQGLAELQSELARRIQRLTSDEGVGMLPITAQRCRDSLQRCANALEDARSMARSQVLREELVAAEIRLAMEELGWIAGEVYTDDLLDRIFSQFCIGK